MKKNASHEQSIHLWAKLETKINDLLRQDLSDEILKQHLERIKNNWPANISNGDLIQEDVEGILNVIANEDYFKVFHTTSPKQETDAIRAFIEELSIFGQYVMSDEQKIVEGQRQEVQDVIDGKVETKRVDVKTHPSMKASPEGMPDAKLRMEKEMYSPNKDARKRIPNK